MFHHGPLIDNAALQSHQSGSLVPSAVRSRHDDSIELKMHNDYFYGLARRFIGHEKSSAPLGLWKRNFLSVS